MAKRVTGIDDLPVFQDDDIFATPYTFKGIPKPEDREADLERSKNRAKIESRTGYNLPPHKRRGKYPMFWRYEADLIIQDERTIAEIAADWNVSNTTILRVKARGKWEGEPYIARDEVDPAKQYEKQNLAKTEEETAQRLSAQLTKRKRGRPVTGGADRFTPEVIKKIGHDPRSIRTIADEYGVSIPFVMKIRKQFQLFTGKDMPVPPSLREAIRGDDRPHREIAHHYNVSVVLVEDIKKGRQLHRLKHYLYEKDARDNRDIWQVHSKDTPRGNHTDPETTRRIKEKASNLLQELKAKHITTKP